MTLPATLFVPAFLRLEQTEIHKLLHVQHDPLATHVYMLLIAHSDFRSGEFLGGYHRLMELCTPPQPERGRRRPGPSYEQLRRVVRDLEALDLVQRNAAGNAAQGQLRLQLTPREKTATPEPIAHRVSHRDIKAQNLGSMRVVASPMDDKPQGIQQGYQGGINTPISPQKPSYPQDAAASKQIRDAALRALREPSTVPLKGEQKAPPGGGQVAASRLMPAAGGDGAEKNSRLSVKGESGRSAKSGP